MKHKFLFFIILISLFGYLYFIDLPAGRRQEALREGEGRIFSYSYDDVKSVNLEIYGEYFTFKRGENGKWVIMNPVIYRADGKLVDKFVTGLLDMKIGRVIGTAPAKREKMDEEWEKYMEQYGLNTPEITVDIVFKSGTETLVFGRPAPYMPMMYAQKGGRILLVERGVRELIIKNNSLFRWRDKKISDVDKEDVKTFDIYLKDAIYLMENKGGDWKIVYPFFTNADDQVVRGLIEFALNADAEAIYDEKPPEIIEDLKPSVLLRFSTAKEKGEIYFYVYGRRDEPEGIEIIERGYAQYNGKYFKISPEKGLGYNIKFSDLRDKRIFDLNGKIVDEIRLFYNKNFIEIKMDIQANRWLIDGKVPASEIATRLENFISRVIGLTAKDFPGTALNEMDMGLKDPAATITLFSNNQKIEVFYIGGMAGENELYTKNSQGTHFIIEKDLMDLFSTIYNTTR